MSNAMVKIDLEVEPELGIWVLEEKENGNREVSIITPNMSHF